MTLIGKKEYRISVFIFLLISLLFRLCFVFTYNMPVDGDQITYDKLALSLLKDRAFNNKSGQPTAYVTPLYPIFLSIVYFFFGHSYLWVKIIQSLLGLFVCLIIYFIAKETFGEGVALVTLFFISIHHFFIIHGVLLLSENLFILWVALSILFLIKFCKRYSYFYGCLFGLFSSLAVLTRSAYFLFPFMTIMILFSAPKLVNIPYKKLFKTCLVIILSFILPISIWTIRNYFIFKSFIPLGTEAGVVLYAAYNPPKGKILDSAARDETTAKAANKPELEYGRFLLKEAILSVKREPAKIYKYIPLRLMYFFSLFDWLSFKIPGTYNFSSAFILLLSFLGIILLIMNKHKYSTLAFVLLFPLIYFILVTIAIMGVPRTRLPVEPYFIIFAAFFVNFIYNHSRYKIRVIAVICIYYLFNYFLYLNSLNTKALVRAIFQRLGIW